MIKNVIFDLSEVLIPGMIGVEVGLEAATGVARDSITKAMGSHPHYEVGNILDSLLKGTLTYKQYRDTVLSNIGLSNIHAKTFDEHCLAMLANPYDFAEEMLNAVSSSYNIFPLSDHCEIWASHIIKKHAFMNKFQDIVWSY